MIILNYTQEMFVLKVKGIFHVILKVFWGQEHLNCLVLLHDLLSGYLNEEGIFEAQVSESVSQMSCMEENQAFKSEQSSDDLRTGLFQYIQDAGK